MTSSTVSAPYDPRRTSSSAAATIRSRLCCLDCRISALCAVAIRRHVSRKLTQCDTQCNVRDQVSGRLGMRGGALAAAVLALALVLPAAAGARKATLAKDGRPNILVVMKIGR